MNKVKYIPGDLVKLKYQGRVVSVVESTINCSILSDVIYTTDDKAPVVPNKNIKGGLLTPEILEKNDWKGIDIMPYPAYAKGKLSEYSLFLDRDVWRFKYDGRILPVEIKFIHQLQHLLFGLGLNSEMKI